MNIRYQLFITIRRDRQYLYQVNSSFSCCCHSMKPLVISTTIFNSMTHDYCNGVWIFTWNSPSLYFLDQTKATPSTTNEENESESGDSLDWDDIEDHDREGDVFEEPDESSTESSATSSDDDETGGIRFVCGLVYQIWVRGLQIAHCSIVTILCRVEDTGNIRTEPKFIVFISQLLLLLKFCPFCKGDNPEVETRKVGTMAFVKCTCTIPGCQKVFTWRSQQYMPGTSKMPAGNFLLCFSMLVAGTSASKIFRVFSHMGLCCISLTTYFRHQKVSVKFKMTYWQIESIYGEYQASKCRPDIIQWLQFSDQHADCSLKDL